MRHRYSRESQTFRHNDFFCTVAVVVLEELPASQSLEAQICGKRRSLGASGLEFLGWVFNSEEQNSPDFLFRVSLRSRTGDHNMNSGEPGYPHWDPGTHASHVQSYRGFPWLSTAPRCHSSLSARYPTTVTAGPIMASSQSSAQLPKGMNYPEPRP